MYKNNFGTKFMMCMQGMRHNQHLDESGWGPAKYNAEH